MRLAGLANLQPPVAPFGHAGTTAMPGEWEATAGAGAGSHAGQAVRKEGGGRDGGPIRQPASHRSSTRTGSTAHEDLRVGESSGEQQAEKRSVGDRSNSSRSTSMQPTKGREGVRSGASQVSSRSGDRSERGDRSGSSGSSGGSRLVDGLMNVFSSDATSSDLRHAAGSGTTTK